MNLPDLYDYLVRARRDLWAVLEGAPDEALSKPLLNGDRFHCIKDLVLHTAEVEDGWLHGDILRVPFVQGSFPELQHRPHFEDVPLGKLLDYWRAVEADTLRHLNALAADPERVVTVEDWPPHHQQFRLDGLLWHVLLHEVRHTAQMVVLLRMQDIKPPSLDLLFYLTAVDSGQTASAWINRRE